MSIPRVIFLLGCTGCGKGAVGRLLMQRCGGEILSVDSMKVYRRMDIGTAKPKSDMRHHLIDVVEPWESFSVARFVELAESVIADAHRRHVPLLAVGGTALYIKALSEGLFDGPPADETLREILKQRAADEGAEALHVELKSVDPDAAGRIHPNDLRRTIRALEVHRLTGQPITNWQTQWDRLRTDIDCRFIGLRRALEDQNQRTNTRVKRMIDEGLVGEVEKLLNLEQPLSAQARQAVGYAEVIDHLEGRLTLDEAIERIKINTRHLAKSQRTWFKRWNHVQWIDLRPDATAEEIAELLSEAEL